MQSRTIGSDVGVSTVRVGLSLLRGIALLVVVTKYVGVETYGQWATVAAVLAVVGAENLHLHGALIRYGGDDQRAPARLADIVALAVVMGVAVGVVVVGLGVATPVLPAIDSPTGVPLSLAVAAVVVVKAPLVVLLNYPRARGRVKRFELLRIARILTETTVMVVGFLWTADVIVVMLGMAGLALVFDVGLAVAFYPRGVVPSLTNARQYLAYSLPMVPTGFAERLLHGADRYLLFVLVSPTVAGIYAAAYAVPRLLVRLPETLHATLYPSVTDAWDADDTAGIESLYADLFEWYVVLALPSAVGLTMLADPLLRRLATPAVAERGAILVPLLCAGFVVQGFAEMVRHVHFAAEATTTVSVGYVAAVTVNLALLFVLIPRNGLVGAAAATVVAQVLLAAYLVGRARTHVDVPLPGGTLLRAAVAASCMALVLQAVRVGLAPAFEIGLFPPLGAVAYVAVLVLLDGMPGLETSSLG